MLPLYIQAKEGQYLKAQIESQFGFGERNTSVELTPSFPSRMSSEEITKLYFDMYLSETEVAKLFEYYKMDFRIFDYSFQFHGVTYK